jgi:hypothetical protein
LTSKEPAYAKEELAIGTNIGHWSLAIGHRSWHVTPDAGGTFISWPLKKLCADANGTQVATISRA